MTEPTKDSQSGTKRNSVVSKLHEHSKKHPINKAHTIALALQRAGFGVGHGSIAGVQIPRVIRPYTGNARRVS